MRCQQRRRRRNCWQKSKTYNLEYDMHANESLGYGKREPAMALDERL